jgi:nitrite reductase/ring-hydroxylating ferredoxin subunit
VAAREGAPLFFSHSPPPTHHHHHHSPLSSKQKGTRREVRVDGVAVLLFWYRSSIYAIENRSPAEGAYSEGFANARLTQDACIECPSTKSLFSLNTGEVTAWYPTNPVLRALTPKDTVRPLRIFPVKLGQDAISVDVSGATGGVGGGEASTGPAGRGGADSSLESNNVFATQPRVYVEGEDTPGSGGGLDVGAVATGAVTAAALVGAGAAGTALSLYVDAPRALIAVVWAGVLAGGVAALRSGKE